MGSVPPITEALRQRARHNPGGWVYAIDPDFDPEGQVPPYAVVGAWRVADSGELTAEFQENPNYRPSAVALEWRQPVTQLERMLQLVATGRQPDTALIGLLVVEPVWIYDRPEGGLYVGTVDSGERVLSGYTDRGLIPAIAGLDATQIVGGRLVEALPDDVWILLNPGHVPFARISPPQVRAVLHTIE